MTVNDSLAIGWYASNRPLNILHMSVLVWDGLGRSQGSSYSSCTNRFNRPSFRSNDSTLQLEDPLLNPYEILLNRHDTSDSSPKKTAPQR